MSNSYFRSIGSLLGLVGAHFMLISACGDKPGALERAAEEGRDSVIAGAGGRQAPDVEATAGSQSGGFAGEAELGPGQAGSPTPAGASAGGDAGAPPTVAESAGAGGYGGSVLSSAGVSGTNTAGDPPVAEPKVPDPTCVFHSPPIVAEPGSAGAGGAGADEGSAGAAGAPPDLPTILIGENDFVGPVLTDGEGYSLYIYSADFPGDCENEPVSTCYEDCALSWPIFDAGERLLGEGLDDALFGTIERDDGLYQTTYLGWPLYHYKRDAEPEMLEGQGKGSIWLAAEIVLPNVIVMRAPQEADGVKYLGDDRGFTLYAYAGDTPGTGGPPTSLCEGECLSRFRPYLLSSLRPATPLEPAELSLFIRQDGLGQQVAYRGVPLYYCVDDERSGEMEGLKLPDFSLVTP